MDTDVNAILQDQLVLLQALLEIAQVTAEAEVCRIALSALTNTGAGMSFLSSSPIKL